MWLTWFGAFVALLLTRSGTVAIYVDPKVLDGCPGYRATNVQTRPDGLTAHLVLGGKPCNVFGDDIEQLLLKVDYETSKLDNPSDKLSTILNTFKRRKDPFEDN